MPLRRSRARTSLLPALLIRNHRHATCSALPFGTLPWLFAVLCVLVALHPYRGGHRVAAQERDPAHRLSQQALQQLVNELRSRLAIPEAVVASIVAEDPLLVSVAPPADGTEPFQLSIDRAFLESLTDEELTGAIAHELGHVWVFTHHPYLQTESLANQIAMRLVSRESLERVYRKVWERGGMKGDLAAFLGPDRPQGSPGGPSGLAR